MEGKQVPISLRIPVDLRDRIRKSAEQNRRSMNGEIVYQLEQSLVANPHFSVGEQNGGQAV